MRSHVCFYLKEFLSSYTFTPFVCFHVKYRGHECVISIGLFFLPNGCGWCGHPVFTAIGPFLFDMGCPGRPLLGADPGGR